MPDGLARLPAGIRTGRPSRRGNSGNTSWTLVGRWSRLWFGRLILGVVMLFRTAVWLVILSQPLQGCCTGECPPAGSPLRVQVRPSKTPPSCCTKKCAPCAPRPKPSTGCCGRPGTTKSECVVCCCACPQGKPPQVPPSHEPSAKVGWSMAAAAIDAQASDSPIGSFLRDFTPGSRWATHTTRHAELCVWLK